MSSPPEPAQLSDAQLKRHAHIDRDVYTERIRDAQWDAQQLSVANGYAHAVFIADVVPDAHGDAILQPNTHGDALLQPHAHGDPLAAALPRACAPLGAVRAVKRAAGAAGDAGAGDGRAGALATPARAQSSTTEPGGGRR